MSVTIELNCRETHGRILYLPLERSSLEEVKMTNYKTNVGNVEIISLTDGQGSGSPTSIFPESNLQEWREYPNLMDGDGNIHPRYGSVAVSSRNHLIIVDTGIGAPDGTLLAEMIRKGVDRDLVDLVVTTHMHPDHIGWNLTDGRPTFPNARYLIPRLDWEYWTSPSILDQSPHVRDQALPLESLDVLDLIDNEYSITDELTTISTPGHTPGHISIVIVSGRDRGFILGDVAHSPTQAHFTDWSPSFDVDPDIARQTRHKILDRLEHDGDLVSSGHFPNPGFGRFVRTGGRRIWQAI